ncbi:MAG: hypothetical protein U5R30_15985 [Deltaproteobacteria bacterium]|nr:hypothetical protein [Deltaproteobacteria bacterium]
MQTGIAHCPIDVILGQGIYGACLYALPASRTCSQQAKLIGSNQRMIAQVQIRFTRLPMRPLHLTGVTRWQLVPAAAQA